MGPCSANCGYGHEIVIRDWKSGENCDKLQQTKQRHCRGKQCGIAVDCKLSEWKNILNCTKNCGGGIQVEQQHILAHHDNNGKKCPTIPPTRTTKCNTHPCPGIL